MQVISDLHGQDEMEKFLNDFLTESEIEVFSKRFAIAYWLKKDRSYENIKQNLKVSSATIASVAQMAKKPGFQLGIRKLEAEEWANKWADRIKKVIK